MPTREQIDRVTSEIEILIGGLEVVCLEGGRVIEASPGTGGYFFWNDLTEIQRGEALATIIDWTGFTEMQRDDVIRRVLDGEEPEFWMDDVEPDDEKLLVGEEFKAWAAEVRQDEHLAKLRDQGVLDVQADVLDALMTRLEAFGDEFERLATTGEQKTLARAFGDLVAEVHSAIKYIVEETYQHGPIKTDSLGLQNHTEQLNRSYEASGRKGLRDLPDEDVQLLLSAKQFELGEVSARLERRQGSELDLLLKGQLEAAVTDLGVEMPMRDGPTNPQAERPEDRFKSILHGQVQPDKEPDAEIMQGVYQIWHRNEGPTWTDEDFPTKLPYDFPRDYTHVANVQAPSLFEAVWRTSNERHGHIDSYTIPGGWPSFGCCESLMDNPRSTLIGDIIIDPAGGTHKLKPFFKFERLDRDFQQSNDIRDSISENKDYGRSR